MGADLPDHNLDLFLEHARYLIDYELRRSNAFETRAAALLGVNTVLLSLTPTVFSRSDPSPLAVIGAVAAVLLIATSAVYGVAALRPTATAAPNLDGFEKLYEQHRATLTDQRFVTTDALVTKLVGDGDSSILDSLAADATRRGKRVTWSTYTMAGAVPFLSVARLVL